MGMRLLTTTYVYDDESPYPTRPVSTISAPSWTPEDRALLMGLQMYEAGLCRCGHPRAVAWHSEMEGWFGNDGEPDRFVCHACSAIHGREVAYPLALDTRPDSKGPMPPFELGVTTTPPSS